MRNPILLKHERESVLAIIIYKQKKKHTCIQKNNCSHLDVFALRFIELENWINKHINCIQKNSALSL